MLIKLAWRNIWRHRVRSGVLFAAIAIGVWAGVFTMAFYYGMSMQRLKTAIEKEISDLQVHHADFKKDYDLQFHIPEGDTLLDFLASQQGVKAVAGRTVSRAMISAARGSAGIMANGVFPEAEDRVTGLSKKLDTGAYFSTSRRNEILISTKTAHKLKLKQGSKAVLTLITQDGHLTSGAFRVAGLFKTTNGPYDELNVFVRQPDLNRLTGMGKGVNEIAVLLESHDDPDSVLAAVRQALPDLQVEAWSEIAPELNLLYEMTDFSSYIFIAIILLGLSFGIVNTMLMSVLERTRELGMIMALGMNKVRVFFMILLETLFLVFSGVPFGLLLAFITVEYTGRFGIDLSMFSDAISGFGYDAYIYPALQGYHYLAVIIMVATAAVLSSLFPARKALMLNPAESIRG